MNPSRLGRSFPLALILVLALPLAAQDIAAFEQRITVRTLDNGLTLLIMERPEAPVFSFFTRVAAGSARDPIGSTGLAHMFEHMAFKGTDKIGTSDYQAELAALEKVEAAYAAYDRERRRLNPDPARLQQLHQAWHGAMAAADRYVIPGEFDEIIQSEGGVGVNAFTSYDETGYFYSMPANRLELWAYLESERYLTPVMREFYKERDVVMEERNMRTESQPIGRLVEQFLGAAFIAHPYRRPAVGWRSDLESFSATDAMEFYRTYYVPSNMMVAVVGDVKAAQALPVLEKYFGRLPKGPEPPPIRTVEPPQRAERTVVIREQTQPFYLEGYHRPNFQSPDDAVYDVISDLLSAGRTSRLYKSLVRDQQIAAVSAGFNGFPGYQYPHLFAFFAVPTPGHTPAQMRAAIHKEIERLKTEDVTDEELQSVKTRARAGLLRGLASNSGLAQNLATYQAMYGDWRELFRNVERMQKVTKEDVRRVAARTFVPENRTVAIIENVDMAEQARGSEGGGR
jgi:predicted Zn-dependent peptidase